MAVVRTDAAASLPAEPARAVRYRPHLDGLRAVAVYLVVAFHAGLGLLQRRVHRRRHVLRPVGLPRHAASSCATSRSTGAHPLRPVLRPALPADPARRRRRAGRHRGRLLDRRDAGRGARRARRRSRRRSSTSRTGTSSTSRPTTSLRTSTAIRCCTSGRSRSRSSSTSCGRCCSRGLYLLAATARAAHGGRCASSWSCGARRVDDARACTRRRRTSNRAYYGTDTRAYQLLAGAALALTPQVLHLGARWERLARWASAGTLVALIVLATALFSFGPDQPRRGRCRVGARAPHRTRERRRGSRQEPPVRTPFTYLGRISYGVYLWHWPIIVVAGYGRDLMPIELFVISAVLATALAALSYRLIEHPIRMSRTLNRYKTPVIAVGFASSILIGLFVMPVILDGGKDLCGRHSASSHPRSQTYVCSTGASRSTTSPPCPIASGDRSLRARSPMATASTCCSWATATLACGSPPSPDREAAVGDLLGGVVSDVPMGTRPVGDLQDS